MLYTLKLCYAAHRNRLQCFCASWHLLYGGRTDLVNTLWSWYNKRITSLTKCSAYSIDTLYQRVFYICRPF